MTRKTSESTLKSKLILLAKLAFVVGLLYFLVQKGMLSLDATRQALSQWQLVLPAFLAFFVTFTLGVFRWKWLLVAHNIKLSWAKVFQLTLIGNFFNIALPGAVSGDFVKAFYIGKEVGGNRSKAFGSILFDRVAGLSALVLVSAGALALGFDSLVNTPLFSSVRVLLSIAAVCVIFFYGYLFSVRERHDPVLKIFQALEKKFKKLASLTRIYESLRHYHNHRGTVLKVLAISVVIHLIVGWCCLSFAQALGEMHLPLLSLYVVVPLGLLITAVPVAPAGVGTGNFAFFYFFHFLGSERGGDVFSLWALSNILIGAVGGIAYFRFKGGKRPDFSV